MPERRPYCCVLAEFEGEREHSDRCPERRAAEGAARIRAHLPCLERAAADLTAPAEVSSRVAAMADLTRTAVNTAERIFTGVDR